MQQYQVRILADQEEAERIATLMEAAFEEEGPVSWFEHDGAWAIDGWFFADSAEALEARVRDCLGSDAFGAPLTVTEVPQDVDWVALSLEGLKPVVAGDFVVFGAHDKDKVDRKLIGLQIEANQAFGTGHHPTTWGCLEALSDLLNHHQFANVLDLGSGSGVLAIAVAKKTGRSVLASDNDPIAVEIADENAGINGVEHLIHAITAEGFEHPELKAAEFDLIVANILADPLKMLAPDFSAHTQPGARVVLSGILDTQADGVLAAYQAEKFACDRVIRKDGWSTLMLQRVA